MGPISRCRTHSTADFTQAKPSDIPRMTTTPIHMPPPQRTHTLDALLEGVDDERMGERQVACQ